MKINEIIKSRRQAAGLTQEQVANYLGVSTPAVNKWGKRDFLPRHYTAARAGKTSRNRFKHTAFL